MEGAGGHLKWARCFGGKRQAITYCEIIMITVYHPPGVSVKTGDCDCSITLSPPVQSFERGYLTSSSKQSYRLWIYDALTAWCFTANKQQIRDAIAFVSGAYFGRRKLKCLNDNDIPIRRTLSGENGRRVSPFSFSVRRHASVTF